MATKRILPMIAVMLGLVVCVVVYVAATKEAERPRVPQETDSNKEKIAKNVGLGIPADSLRSLLDSLKGGPIEIAAAEHKPDMIGRAAALQCARLYTGFPAEPANAWKVVVTDREFTSAWLQGRPCWLLEYRDQKVGQDDKILVLSGYVVIDAETGIFWEAFTRPEKPWWNDVKRRNAEIAKIGKALPPRKPPKLNLSMVLAKVANVFPESWAKAAKQVVVRLFVKDRDNYSYVFRIEGEEDIYRANHQVWYVSFQGIDLPAHGGPLVEGPPLKRSNIQEWNLSYDAETGKLFGYGGNR